MKKKINYYDLISSSYEELYKEEQLKKIVLIKNEVCPKKGDYVLDLGSGPGFLKFTGVNCTIVRLDPSKELLNKASGIKVLGIAEKMSFSDNYFDLIISVTAMQNFDDINKAIAEIKRVAKPDANIALSFLKKSEKCSFIKTAIEDNFHIVKLIEEEKDLIFILKL
jgi:ubiquinone/menaquinone biosynthesis C-methylase UbiE